MRGLCGFERDVGGGMMIPSGTGVLEKQSSGPRGGSDLQEEAPDPGKRN